MASAQFHPRLFEALHRNVNVAIDSLQTLYNAIEVLELRAGKSVTKEVEENRASSAARADMELLCKTLAEVVRLEVELGIRTKKSGESDNLMDLLQTVKENMKLTEKKDETEFMGQA